MSNPKCPWCGEQHQPELIRLHGDLATTCPRLGANEAVMISRPDLVAMARTADGSPVVAFQPHGLEVHAFGADDLDARGLPRWKP